MNDNITNGVSSSFASRHLDQKIDDFKTKAATTKDEARLREVAEEFESIFISQMLGPMMQTVKTDDLFGGGQAEGIYRSMMVDEVGKAISKGGGIGIADQVYNELIKLQEGN